MECWYLPSQSVDSGLTQLIRQTIFQPALGYVIWLVVYYPSEKYEFVNGKDDIPYMKWKIKNVPTHQPVMITWGHVSVTSEHSRWTRWTRCSENLPCRLLQQESKILTVECQHFLCPSISRLRTDLPVYSMANLWTYTLHVIELAIKHHTTGYSSLMIKAKIAVKLR